MAQSDSYSRALGPLKVAREDNCWILSTPDTPIHIGSDLFRPEAAEPLGSDGGRGVVCRVTPLPSGNQPAIHLILRPYRRGGLPGRLVDRRYLWTGLSRSRPARELLLTHRLHQKGLPVPTPVGARVCRKGLTYTGELLTVEIPRSQTFASCIEGDPAQSKPWFRAGRAIRRVHDTGAFHADLNARNLLLDGRGQVIIIDWDRGRLRRIRPGWRRSNLLRLRRSLSREPALDEAARTQWPTLMEGYLSDIVQGQTS